MPTESAQARVEFTPEFKRNLRALSKKYRHIRSDVQPAIERLQAGEFFGDRISRTQHVVFKARAEMRARIRAAIETWLEQTAYRARTACWAKVSDRALPRQRSGDLLEETPAVGQTR